MFKTVSTFLTRSFLTMLLLLIAFAGSAQNQRIIFDEQSSEKHGATLITERSESVTVKFNLNELNLQEVNTEDGTAYVVNSPKAPNVLQKGYPDLFYLAQSIIIPNKGGVEIESVTGDYEEFNDVEVAPSKGNLTRDIDPNQVPYEKGKIYQVNEFYPNELANLRDPFILRDFRGQSIEVNPVQYNPVTKTLRVYTDLTVNVKYTDKKGANELNRSKTASNVDAEFSHIYSSMFLNFNKEKYTQIEEDGELLIICYDDFVDAMQPFVNWKKTIGRNTTLVPKSEVGSTSSAIKDYIQSYYDDPENNLTYVLLVGDAPQIPTNAISSGDSDNYYGYLEGDDSYSEIFIGRFSAETVAHVETQVQRMIEYERDMTEEDTWLNVGMGVARNEGDGGGHNGEADYVHMDFIRDTLLNYTYTEVHREYDGDVPGETNTTAAEISTNINDGLSIINFCNHGSVTGWSVANYSSSDVNELTNSGKLPFIWSVACVNGDFVSNTCFAETWLRATDNNEPSGAIGTMMSTINQAWQPPMTGQDEMVGILSESFEDNIKRTYGGISINGSMKMLDLHGASGIETHDTWTLFGDPTLLVRTDTPEQMNVTHNPTMFLGSTSFSVSCDTDDAVVTISYTDESEEVHILATSKVEAGTAELVFDDPVAEPLDLTVTVVGYNKVTYQGELSAVPADEPYVILKSFETASSPDFGQNVELNAIFENISEEPYTANNVAAEISIDSEYATLVNADVSLGTINPDQQLDYAGAFEISISDEVPDQTSIPFEVVITADYDGDEYEWTQSFSVKANAPVLGISNFTILSDDDENGQIDPGESAQIAFDVENVGNANASDILVSMVGNSPFFEMNTPEQTVTVNADGSTQVVFDVQANASSTEGSDVTLTAAAEQGVYNTEGTHVLTIGTKPEIVVGEGDDDNNIGSGYYLFDNYYKANRTQVLYLQEEIGTAPQTIEQIGFDFVNVGDVSPFRNLKIKLLEVDADQTPGSFIANEEAVIVLDEEEYELPTQEGWYMFDIDDFEYSGENNLLVEITWGINDEWSSNRYLNSSTSQDVNLVEYGYSDSEQIPSHSGSTSMRPNIFFSFAAEQDNYYSVEFTVLGEDDQPLEGAEVIVGSMPLTTYESGVTSLELPTGTYNYYVTAEDYIPFEDQFTVSDAAESITVNLAHISSADKEPLSNLTAYPNPFNNHIKVDGAKDVSHIEIVNMLGQRVELIKLNRNETHVIPTEHLSQGIYLVSFTTSDGERSVIRMIKE